MRRCLLVLLCLMWCPAQALQITDDRGVSVVFEQPPQRIVSLLPSLSETVCALGECQRLVGVDRYSRYPRRLRRLPQLGGNVNPDIEAIVALRPDLVLISTAAPVAARLQGLGLKVMALKAENYDDARRALDEIGRVLGVKNAPRLWQDIEQGIDAAAASLPPRARQLQVYYEVGQGPFAAGESSFIGQTLARLGVRNIVPASLGTFPKLSPEFVVRADPGLVIVNARSASDLARRPGWSAMRAVREQRICTITPEQEDIVTRPGPRMAEGARILAACIQEKGLAP